MSHAEADPAPGPAGPRTLQVRTAMGTWSCAVHGERRRAGDPDVLLLHGLFVDASLWRAQIEPLSRLGRVLVLDMPGHGRSDVPPPFRLPDHAEALAGALASLDVRRAICVGWSWGGELALHLALRHPARVAALAVLDSAAEPPPRRLKYRVLVGLVRRFGVTPWLARRQIAPLMFSERAQRQRPELVEAFVRSATALPREVVVRAATAVAIEVPSLLAALGAVAVPTLVLGGREDRALAAGVRERLAAAIPGARLEWVDGAGHLSVLERPDEVNRLLVPFVAEVLG